MSQINPGKLPAFHDPFAGGGALPLEAQRLGLESYASDLNDDGLQRTVKENCNVLRFKQVEFEEGE